MDRVERVATDAEGVWFKRVLRVAAAFTGDMAEVGAKCWREKNIGLKTGRKGSRRCPRRHNFMMIHTGQCDFNEGATTQM